MWIVYVVVFDFVSQSTDLYGRPRVLVVVVAEQFELVGRYAVLVGDRVGRLEAVRRGRYCDVFGWKPFVSRER